MTHQDTVASTTLASSIGEEFGLEVAKCQEAYRLLNSADIGGEESQAIDASLIVKSPEVFGQMLMNQLVGPMEIDPEVFTIAEKQWWLAVAAHIGPDWLAKLRRVAAFMDKCEGF